LIKSSTKCGQVTFDAQGVPQLPVETLLAFAQQPLDGSMARIFTMKYVGFMEKNVFFFCKKYVSGTYEQVLKMIFGGDLSHVKT
jgi:hypothetical protein